MPSGWSPGACTCAALDVAMILSALEIEWVVREIICRECDLTLDRLGAEVGFHDLPGIESIRILRSVVRIESHFDVELDDEVVFRVRNVRELASAILEDLESDDSEPLSAAGAGT